jgi:UPF0716 protein FxsA
MARLLLAFILVPIVELALLIELGRHVGLAATLGLIVVTGTVGAWLARRQGLGVLRRMREETAAGTLPAEAVVDGVIIVAAGALLLTPGLLTDAVGFACLVPASRRWLKSTFRRRFEAAVRQGRVRVSVDLHDAGDFSRRPVRDVTPREPGGHIGAREPDRPENRRGTASSSEQGVK